MNPTNAMNSKNPEYERIVFCDFDGTITAVETFIGMLKRFASENYARIEQMVINRKITLAEAVRRMVESIPSSSFAGMQEYIRSQTIRPGFAELLDFLRDNDVPFVVISGGLMEQLQTRLEEFQDRILCMHAARINLDLEYIRVISAFESEQELVSKKAVMDTYDYGEAIAIGDGITDMSMADRADMVFARGHLCRYLDQIGKPYQKWDTFFDIRNKLADRWRLG